MLPEQTRRSYPEGAPTSRFHRHQRGVCARKTAVVFLTLRLAPVSAPPSRRLRASSGPRSLGTSLLVHRSTTLAETRAARVDLTSEDTGWTVVPPLLAFMRPGSASDASVLLAVGTLVANTTPRPPLCSSVHLNFQCRTTAGFAPANTEVIRDTSCRFRINYETRFACPTRMWCEPRVYELCHTCPCTRRVCEFRLWRHLQWQRCVRLRHISIYVPLLLQSRLVRCELRCSGRQGPAAGHKLRSRHHGGVLWVSVWRHPDRRRLPRPPHQGERAAPSAASPARSDSTSFLSSSLAAR